jgi:hypothetical protein
MISEALLPKLTAEDLKDLGVTSIGHRRMMLDAIAALSAAPTVAVAPPTPAPQPQAERRQLTVMFCRLVGSTALSARLDAEDLRAVIGAYHRCAAMLIERSGRFVAKYMGDGVLAYFRLPSADEHDAEGAGRGRHRDRRGRRTARPGRGAGTGGGLRDAKPRGAAAGHGRSGFGRDRTEHAAVDRRTVRLRGSRGRSRSRPSRTGRGLASIAPVYGWFTEGFDTPVLQEAKALLAEFSSSSAPPTGKWSSCRRYETLRALSGFRRP